MSTSSTCRSSHSGFGVLGARHLLGPFRRRRWQRARLEHASPEHRGLWADECAVYIDDKCAEHRAQVDDRAHERLLRGVPFGPHRGAEAREAANASLAIVTILRRWPEQEDAARRVERRHRVETVR
jgi:hypothetical protein